MEYGHLRENRRGLQLPILEIFSALLFLTAVVLTMLELVSYSNTVDALQTDLTIAGIPVGGLEEDEAQARWEAVYIDQPITLVYGGSTIMLDPVTAGFRTNSDAMLAEARAQNSQEKDFWGGFWNFLWRRPVAAVNVPLDADYSESDLRAYLEDLSARYDSTPGSAGFDVNTLMFQSGASGSKLDVDAAVTLIADALFQPEPAARRIVLPTVNMDAQGQSMDMLEEAILDLIASRGFANDGVENLVSAYVMDLETGEEISILGDVVHSGISTIKIPIMINLFRDNLSLPDEIAYLLTASILCSDNSASNWLMQFSGDDKMDAGLNEVSCTAQDLGAEHTFISAALWVGYEQPEFPVCRPQTPGNTQYKVADDAYAQTTAEDMGLLLTQIYDCANYGSGLKAVYPDDITQTECQQMIEVLSGNRIDRLIELGVPFGTKIAHKNGWAEQTSGDAGIVFSPGGDYVLVLYVWEPDTDNNDVMTIGTWELMEEISRLVYNYFNPTQPMIERRAPINEFGAIDCVTVATEEQVNLDNINENRLDENGNPLPGACYGGPGDCKPFDNWGQATQ